MYTASADFLTILKSNIRKFKWSGSIVTVGGTTYDFDTDKDTEDGKIVSGSITRGISSQTLNIGTVYAGSLSIEVILPGVSRYELYGGIINIECSLDGASDVIPMGIYTISEANQTADHISLKAYDNMIKFAENDFFATSHVNIQSPYTWLSEACAAAGVALGNSRAEVTAMANGNRNTGFADSVADVKTWRDVLSYMAAYLGGFAYIGRDGSLYIGYYEGLADDSIPPSFRYSSNLSDFRTTYNGLYATCKEEGLQEYVYNTNADGLVLDIGTNPFLQFTDQGNRLAALQEIIDKWDGIYYVPYSAELPLAPIYDPGDVLAFTGNQADIYDIGAITEITYNIGGSMPVKCAGDNPLLAAAQDRFTKTIAGLSSDYNNGQEVGGKNFWLLHTENTSALTVGSTKTKVAEIEFKQTVDVQRIGLMFCCEGLLSATAVIDIEITIDDNPSYTFTVSNGKTIKGTRDFERNCGFRITGKGTHTAKVYITVTDNSLKWGDLA